ncbi:DUF3267 domain-containing protein [Clostridium lundense]|uniref:DUF3267 domain-containing protein n=1 Tax=Clostridium lundense TaxID=319475 RepID=UPI000B29BBA4|nr:DUF3267 domain-containing protein [Clostridium lundense]
MKLILWQKGVGNIKVKNNMPKADKEKHLALVKEQWVQLKEPKSIGSAILISVPIMILNAIITVSIINIVSPISLKEFGLSENSFSININGFQILGIFLTLIIHEFIHLIFIPNFIKSDETFIGLTPFGGYVYSEEVIAKSRYILITIAPFIVISIILPLILGVLGLLSPSMKFLILLNSMGASVDILNLINVLFQVPSSSNLTSCGMNTYWKKI